MLASGLGLIVLDGTIVGVALPEIIRSINLNLTYAQWVNSIYAVLLAALLLSTGKVADRIGRKRLFLIGLAIFALGSRLAALSASAAPLIACRAVQAVGAAMIMPSTLSTVNATFRGKYRAAAFGVWGAVISGAAAIGPLAGGWCNPVRGISQLAAKSDDRCGNDGTVGRFFCRTNSPISWHNHRNFA